ncbi:O-antigen polymerase [Bifidobacterium mongoliense]|uniref:O-antigen polymerase n=1 Tax=Bifidobacterium mongoliense TaxID=518643 RepID=UPI0030EE158E
MSTIFLLLFLIGLLFIGYRITGSSLVSPSVIFLIPFIVAIIYGLMFYSSRIYTFSIETCMVIGVGCLAFTLLCSLAHIIFKSARRESKNAIVLGESGFTLLPSSFYFAVFIFNCISFIEVYRAEKAITIQYGQSGALADTISSYNNLSKFGDDGIALNGIPSYLFQISYASCFILGYLLAKQLTNSEERVSRLCLGTYLFSSIGLLLIGSRSLTITSFVALGIMCCILGIQNGTMPRFSEIPVKAFAFVALGLFVAISVFLIMLSAVGRDLGTLSPWEYIAIYLSAPLKNLDIFISNGYVSSDVFGQYTFTRLYESLIKIINLDPSILMTIKQYQSFHGLFLGNVYSAFQSPLKDFGPLGCTVVMGVTALIMQTLYEYSVRERHSNGLPYAILFYGYLSYSLLFSFFSNMFFETVVSTGFLKFTVSLLIIGFATSKLLSRELPGNELHRANSGIRKEERV